MTNFFTVFCMLYCLHEIKLMQPSALAYTGHWDAIQIMICIANRIRHGILSMKPDYIKMLCRHMIHLFLLLILVVSHWTTKSQPLGLWTLLCKTEEENYCKSIIRSNKTCALSKDPSQRLWVLLCNTKSIKRSNKSLTNFSELKGSGYCSVTQKKATNQY